MCPPGPCSKAAERFSGARSRCPDGSGSHAPRGALFDIFTIFSGTKLAKVGQGEKVTAVAENAAQGVEEVAQAGGKASLTDGAVGTGPRGPVVFKDPAKGATPAQIAQIRAYVEGSNNALHAGALSSTGRVSTAGKLRQAATSTAAEERAANPGAYATGQHVGHVPDTTWTGNAVPHSWMALDEAINTSLGAQAGRYPHGYQPTSFWYLDDYIAHFGRAPDL